MSLLHHLKYLAWSSSFWDLFQQVYQLYSSSNLHKYCENWYFYLLLSMKVQQEGSYWIFVPKIWEHVLFVYIMFSVIVT